MVGRQLHAEQDTTIVVGFEARDLHLAMHDLPGILLAAGKEKG
jgi:hypothetical protein